MSEIKWETAKARRYNLQNVTYKLHELHLTDRTCEMPSDPQTLQPNCIVYDAQV
jgi:hypothetical protein